MRKRFLVVMGLALMPLAGAAADLPDEVETYRRALEALQSPVPTASLEEVFSQGLEARRALLAVDAPGGATILEMLGEGALRSVIAGMPGFAISQAAVRVVLDPDFFLALARRHGQDADVGFFEAYRDTMGPNGWPTYVEPLTEHTGCVKYGSLRLVEAYRRWTAYRERVPDRYPTHVGEVMRDIEAQLAAGTCACEARASVLNELRAFVETFGTDPLAPSLRDRMRAIESGTSDIRFVCVAG